MKRLLSVADAGKLGGKTTLERHGVAHFKRAAKIQGIRNREERGREYFSAMGKRSQAKKKALKEAILKQVREQKSIRHMLARFLTKGKID